MYMPAVAIASAVLLKEQSMKLARLLGQLRYAKPFRTSALIPYPSGYQDGSQHLLFYL